MLNRLGSVFGVSIALLLGLSPSALRAQRAPAYGPDGISTYVVGAWEMTPGSFGQWGCCTLPNLHRWVTNGDALFGVVHLPQGALILAIELEFCDTSTTSGVVASLLRTTVTGAGAPLAVLDTGDVAAPGCGTLAADLVNAETVENATNRYTIRVTTLGNDDTTTLGAVRVFYVVPVSPAPAIPSFNDVPTSDPAFQFIEALVASGVTVGCGSGNYCPDAPLTRRQMAVFLAKLVGLYWPDGPQF
jgi:hypothetical protein